jgi:hypothetical protein
MAADPVFVDTNVLVYATRPSAAPALRSDYRYRAAPLSLSFPVLVPVAVARRRAGTPSVRR